MNYLFKQTFEVLQALFDYIETYVFNKIGAAGGLATLNEDGKIPNSQIGIEQMTQAEASEGVVEDGRLISPKILATTIAEKVSPISGEVETLDERTDNINERLETVEQLAEISIGGGDIGIATAEDFDDPSAAQRAKVPTVGAVLDCMDEVPTPGSVKPVQSGGVYKEIEEYTSKEVSKISKVWELTQEQVINENRYINLSGANPVTSQMGWRVTTLVALSDLIGTQLHFFGLTKAANDVLSYALYSGTTVSTYIQNSGYGATENGWRTVSVDELMSQFPTAKYIRFTLHLNNLNFPYTTISLKSIDDKYGAQCYGTNIANLGIGIVGSRIINSNGGLASANNFVTSELIPKSLIAKYKAFGYNAYSTANDARTFALYDDGGNTVFVSDPNASGYYERLIELDFDDLFNSHPSATQVRLCYHVNRAPELVVRGSIVERIKADEVKRNRPTSSYLDNFTFAAANSAGIIPVLSNRDADASIYESLFINFAQIITIGNHLICYYFASSKSGEYSQNILCAYSDDGVTWTRGFPPEVVPPVPGTPLLFDSRSTSYKPITEACWCKVPDSEYPYRMIANQTERDSTAKKCCMWRSADGYNYEFYKQVLPDNYRCDTQFSAVVRGNVIKLYVRISENVSSGYKRSIGVTYIDLNGNILTPPYKLINDYEYTSAACELDNFRELLMPTWFSNNNDSAPKTENAYLQAFIVEGDKWKELETNINDCLKQDTLWMMVSPSFVTVNKEQYILVYERNTDHASSPDTSSLKLVKVTRS